MSGILANREYLGMAILNRKTSRSYKDHRKFIKPEDEWIIHENAHPAIIDAETFDTVQRIRSNRRQVTRHYAKGALDDVMKTNTGEVPQFYVEGSHEGIIAPHEFDLVQVEIERRKGIGGHYSGSSLFSSKLVCADCGAFFGQKVWHSTDKYRKVIWRCNAKFDGEHKCATPHLTEDEIKAMFLKAYNQLMGNREQVIADCRLMLEMLSDHSKLDAQIAKANEEIALVSGLVSACVHENTEKALSQDVFNKRYNGLVDRHQKAMERLEKLKAACADKVTRQKVLRNYIDTLMTAALVLDAWDEQLWRLLVIKGIVGRDGNVEFEFRNGLR